MVCMEFEPGAAKLWAQTSPLSYGGTPYNALLVIYNCLISQSLT